MKKSFPRSSSFEVFHGDYFSVFLDGSDCYWVVSNDRPRLFKGPLDKGTALKLMISSNEFYNSLTMKGLLLL